MLSNRCLYNEKFNDFCNEDNNSIFGKLCDRYHGVAQTTIRESWKEEISIIKNLITPYKNENGQIIFEYNIPRLGKRIDVVLLFRGIIFCLEFKVGTLDEQGADIDQVLDYALDLKNFHKFSQDKIIVPILIPTNYSSITSNILKSAYNDGVVNPLCCGKNNLSNLFKKILEKYPNELAVNENWIISPYTPTPTIIEAAKTLYENHSVQDITRHEADKVSTDQTINYVLEIIKDSKANGKKSICFVTGLPGAGKTLVGLDVAIKQTYQYGDKPIEDEGTVYLSAMGI